MTKQPSFKFMITVLGFLLAQSVSAQVKVGLRAGYLLTNAVKDPLEQGEPTPEPIGGYQVAIPIEFNIGNLFAVQPELMFGTHGARQEVNNSSTDLGITTVSSFKSRYQISSLEIPLLAKLKFGPDAFRFHLLAGPSVGLGLTGKYTTQSKFKSTTANGSVIIDQSSSDEYAAKFVNDGYKTSDVDSDEFAVTPINFNLHFGAGVSIDLGGPDLFLDARYMLGLSDLRPEADGDSRDVSYKSQRIGVSLGLMIPL